MYYIYHIPGVKIGCSTNPNRRVSEQGFSNFEILEKHNDIDIASQREVYLQKQYGYNEKFTTLDYKHQILNWQRKSIEVRTGTQHSSETKEKMSKARMGKESPRKNVILTAETKSKMSEARKRYWEMKKKNII
jgi:hypothetical protein